ncbi:MAG: hypothetical protein HKP24_02320 [Croceitalea sp.]|nr:hypothetical protein [Croceitalea sp.]
MQNNNTTKNKQIEKVQIENEAFFKIANSDSLRPFFMSVVSDSNHWMFISSNGGLTAGRKNAEYALFPYYSDDKITESAEITGSKTMIRIIGARDSHIWEPFSNRFEGVYKVSRNLYKNVYGNKILFEEVNHDLKLAYRYQWCSSDRFGFVRKSALINQGDKNVKVSLLDGIQNILPYGVSSDLQNKSSNLVDAYKRSEVIKNSGLGIYALSAIIVDKAEPSEALKANVVWSMGLDEPTYLLSSLQLNNFRKKKPVHEELDIKAEKGAYFVQTELDVAANNQKEWMLVANVNQNHAAIFKLSHDILKHPDLLSEVNEDIELGTKRLIALTAASDGLQLTNDELRDTRHFANTMFNIMRGGTFDDNYKIEKWDFTNYLKKANDKVYGKAESIINALPDEFTLSHLKAIANNYGNSDFKRLSIEYMPLKFSRRHGDPSRPWNRFSINTRSEIDGSKILDYEGNWRDIFQNWEALAHSYPEFMDSMIHKFLNASTFDGYNPYRVTKGGFDWEIIEPDDPWSYIGYWGDHQIIYLLKFLEFIQNHSPGQLEHYFAEDIFVYANVPYNIKSYSEILKNPKDTIEFDEKLDKQIRQKRVKIGADGALLSDQNGAIYKVNFIEKILATVMAKMSNFIPEGGIWMNTQRPEWNDANNALVGNGVSMVTLYYLRRFLKFFDEILESSSIKEVAVSEEIRNFFNQLAHTLDTEKHILADKVNDQNRKKIMDGLGKAASEFRLHVYDNNFSGKKKPVTLVSIKQFVQTSLDYLEHSIKANKRVDELYHAYNLMTVENEKEVSISYLSEMLEGQVAVLSSGFLSSKEALKVLDGLKKSKLFREDQYSYILYPNKELPLFVDKNKIPQKKINQSKLLKAVSNANDKSIVEKDINGIYHFNGNFKNANDLEAALNQLSKSKDYGELVHQEKALVLQIFEDIFDHKSFTGRSGTFFGYEGLGSIYWHMVSKLQLAVQECCLKAVIEKESDQIIGRLLEHYYEINEGIGVHKPPALYGAFPTDPYSHTPAGKGAQQPGMTGQVKEDILSRFGELGVFVKDGNLVFDPCLLRKDEFIAQSRVFKYVDVHSNEQEIKLEKGSLCFTYCQVPVIYRLAKENGLEVLKNTKEKLNFKHLGLDKKLSKHIFERTGEIDCLTIHIKESDLK